MMNDRRADCILLENEELEYQAGIPICGANLSTPVINRSNFISEIHYQIGNKLYIENADQLGQLFDPIDLMNKLEHQRDTELENIEGSLLIAEYQVETLKDRLIDKVGGKYTHLADRRQSTHIFKRMAHG